MKKLQKIIFFLGAISLVVFGNKEALSTITSKVEEEMPQVEVITSTPETVETPVTPEAQAPVAPSTPTSVDPTVPATTKKKVVTPVKPVTPAKPATPAKPTAPAAVEKPKEEVKTTIEEPAKKEKATSSK
jgi:hypothetical protein